MLLCPSTALLVWLFILGFARLSITRGARPFHDRGSHTRTPNRTTMHKRAAAQAKRSVSNLVSVSRNPGRPANTGAILDQEQAKDHKGAEQQQQPREVGLLRLLWRESGNGGHLLAGARTKRREVDAHEREQTMEAAQHAVVWRQKPIARVVAAAIDDREGGQLVR